MTISRSILLAALAALGLAGLPACKTAAPAPGAPAAGAGAAPEAGAAADPLAGVDLDDLTPEQRAIVRDWASRAFCYCGCPHTVTSCLRTHQPCKHAARMTRLAARLVAAGAGPSALPGLVDEYYASFDRRMALATDGFGPPLGDPAAPVTLLEFSDFTCPFCRGLRPALERFVEEHPGRVKLVFKPFPIEAHPGALEAAQAGEWARDQGIFWPLHDALFEAAAPLDVDAIAAAAREAGGDAGDLRDALASRKYLDKIRVSQAEARAAGLRGTPTLFLNGRYLALPDYSPAMLLHALEDEEEWQRHQGWERD
ncbi:thioredoxin domain-containing protein [Anaeromyxobacter sp. PSR-1]|uniref:DsbA family protein n=1 Tax=Anaeromyxobacter sp. PSR-1 TaxID=1300915 RepID=UPI0005E6BC0F|nr:thioredoxin domain-containing protein [Anaeromyxobacter sp. PSR-1]GAO05022.1 Na(+)/H(+) antiporter NhaA 2 [Anaeromyxobacter sp. PSR-1]